MLDARIDITLRTDKGRVTEVAVRSSRRVTAAALFAGRRPDEVAAILPTVFALCGAAQHTACRTALADALGLPSPDSRRALLTETVSEHGLGILRDWPALIGEPADLEAARTLRSALAAGNPAKAETVLTEAVGGLPDDFRVWAEAGRSPAARLLRMAEGWTLPGSLMPVGGPPDLRARLAEDASGAYAAAPDHDGTVYETGPLARQAGHPLVAPLGDGVGARLAARIVEAVSALRELARIGQDSEPVPLPEDTSGVGLGVVEAARGLLAHRVELKDGRVTSYRILAPTEWNFHPRGPLVRGLLDAPADDTLIRRANILVAALDPCVACSVTVTHA